MLYQGVTLWVIYRGAYWRYGEALYQRSEVLLKIGTIFKHKFTWMWIPKQPCLIKHITYHYRQFVYELIISTCYLRKVEGMESDNLLPACGRIDNCHAGEACILLDDFSPWLMLYY